MMTLHTEKGTVLVTNRMGRTDEFYRQVKASLEKGSVIIPVSGEANANNVREQLKRHGIECDIVESWDPTKEGLSSRGHMDDPASREWNKEAKLRSITLKKKSCTN